MSRNGLEEKRVMRSVVVKLASIFCVSVMMTVAFQQLQKVGGPSDLGESDGVNPGENWESSRPVTLSRGESTLPSAAVAGDGLIHLAWVDTRSGSPAVFYKRSIDGGSTFTSDRRLSEAGGQPGRPSVAVSSDGEGVVVAWEETVESVEHTGRAVLFRESTNEGSSFKKTTFVAFGRSPAVRFWSNDLVLVFLQDDWANGTSYLRILRVSQDEKGQGRVEGLLSFESAGKVIGVAVTGSLLHVVWDEEAKENHVVLHASVDMRSGAADGAHLISVVNGEFGAGSLVLAAFEDTIAAAWSERRNGFAKVYLARSLNGGLNWGTSMALTEGMSNALSPAVAFNSTGSLFAVWQDDVLSRWQLFGRQFSGVDLSLGTPVRLTWSDAFAAMPMAVADGAENAYLFWHDGRGGRTQIYMDNDLSLRRPAMVSVITFAGRLPLSAFAKPEGQSRLYLLGLLKEVRSSIFLSEEQTAAAQIRNLVLPRMDGSIGGKSSDDLLIDPKAQTHLAWSLRLLLRQLDPPSSGDAGTRGEALTEPILDEPLPPDTTFEYADFAPVYNITVFDITSTTATVSWETDPPAVYATWLNWGPTPDIGNLIPADPGNPYTVTITNLTANTMYYYAVEAVLYQTCPPAMYPWYDSFYTGVVIEDIGHEVTSASEATVWWETNIPSTTVVIYNTTEDYGLMATGESGTYHWVELTDLDPRHTYHFQAESAALSDPNLWAQSTDMNFTTHLEVGNLTMGGGEFADGSYHVKLSWNSTREATSEVRYGNTTLYGAQVNGTSGLTHNATLWNLSSATTYYYQARSVGLDNANDSDAVEGTPFATPPISVYNITLSVDADSAQISWESNYNGTTVVRHGLTSNYTSNQTGSNGTEHSVTLDDLASSTTYHFRVESTSLTNVNDTAVGLDRAFTTQGILVSNVHEESVGTTSATIEWSTNFQGTSVLRFGRSSIWESVATGENGTAHSVTIEGLLPETKYYYRAESSSLGNLNDTNISSVDSFDTLYAPNDADSGTDAGDYLGAALSTEPGEYVGREEYPGDQEDFYRFRAYGNQTMAVRLDPPSNMDLDLLLLGPGSTLKASSTLRGLGVAESITYTADENGFWYIEVRLYNVVGGASGYYGLKFNATGGSPDRLVLDVGTSGDDDILEHVSGLSLDVLTGWGEASTSTSSSTATFRNIGNNPTYREATAGSTFYLNLYRHSPQKYTDYILTFQYYGSEDVNVSLYNGAGWVNVTNLPAKTNWWTWSFVLEHTLFYDGLPSTIGINVAMRLSDLVEIDMISAVAYGYATYVGHGSDDNDTLYHLPGVLTWTGWNDSGGGYRDGSNCSEVILNIPDANATYNIDFRFKGDVEILKVEQYDDGQWIALSTLVSFGPDNYFNTNQSAYFDALPAVPGMNVRIRFVASAVREFTYASMHIVRWFDEVGVTGDNCLWLHEPGMSLYPNGQWGAVTQVDGRSARYGGALAEIYLNAPLADSDYVVYVTYKTSSSGGEVRQWYGQQWETLGAIQGDNGWHTGRYRTNSSIYRDHYGSDLLNVMLQFTVGLYVDRMWAEPVIDGDHVTEYGKTESGPEGDPPEGDLPISFDFPVYASGTFSFHGNSQITFSGTKYEERVQRFTLNNTVVHELVVCGSTIQYLEGCVHTQTHKTHTFGFGFNVHIGAGPKTMMVEGDGKILDWRFVRLTTDPDLADADGDGLNNYDESNTHHTNPGNPDTDGDGLTDFDEVATFDYQNHSQSGYEANVTFNMTVDAFARYHYSVTTDATSSGGNVSAQVYLDGQLKASKNDSDGWSGHVFSFVASLAKGLHSLQVQRGSGSGTVTVHDVVANNVEETSPLFADSDLDGVSDGDEMKGTAGFYTSPADADTDDDQLLDGYELSIARTDPMRKDTDGDGFNDNVDLDPLHDLIVQVWLKELFITDSCPQGQQNCLWYGEVGINGNYTRGKATELTDYEPRGNHYISVNVPDDKNEPKAMIVIKAFRNDGTMMDLTPSPGINPLVIDFTVGDNKFWGSSGGTGSGSAAAFYEIRTIKFAKVNTVLMTPTDWSTVLNGSTGMHRFVGEQRFAVLNVNTVDATGAEAYWNMETTESIGAASYYTDLTGHNHRASPGNLVSDHGHLGSGVSLDGIDDYVAVSDHDKLDFSNETTISFWVNPGSDYTGSESIWYWSVGKQESWRIGWVGSTRGLQFDIVDESSITHTVSTPFLPLYQGNWYHIVGIYDGMSMSIFVNGVRKVKEWEGAFSIFNSSHGIEIGMDPAEPPHYFHGVVDEVALYGRALNDSEVALVNDRILDLDMDTRTDSTCVMGFKDLSGHGNDAYIEGGNFTDDNSKPVEGERGLAVQILGGSHLQTGFNRGIDVHVLTLSARLYWEGGAGTQGVAAARGSFSGTYGDIYSLKIAGPNGGIVYEVRRGSTIESTTVQGFTLPPDSWHVITLTYDGTDSIVYLDGEQIHKKTWSQVYLAHPSSPYLCIFNCPGSSPFNGYLDDLTVWNRTLSQGEIRALNYLDRGLNGIVVPRGLFFQSQFFSNLNTTTFSYSSPVLGATAIGNDNPRELNARTIQQLVAANLTLAQAWTWIDQLTRANDTGNVTSFPLVVTDEIYTIGFDSMVLNVLPNVTVENSGNSSVPPPPIRQLSFWEAVWNSFTGLVSALWNAVVAVATFVANIALAVIKWCMDFAVAIANGEGLQFFYDTVVKPFVEAILAFIRWIVDMVKATLQIFVDGVLDPALEGLKDIGRGLASAMITSLEMQAAVGNAVGQKLLDYLPQLIVFAAIVVLVVTGIGYFINPFPFIGILLAAVFAVVLMASLIALIPDEEPASDQNSVGQFLDGIDTQYGDALLIFQAVDLGILTALSPFLEIGGNLAPEFLVIKAFVIATAAIITGWYAKSCTDGHQGGACPAGILSLVFSGLAITLSTIALLSVVKLKSIGQMIAFTIFNVALLALSTLSFLGDTGFVLKYCR